MTPGSATYGDYVEDLHHGTFNANLDFISGYAADFIGFDVAGFAAANLATGNGAHPNEISLSSANQRWGEDWSGDKGGFNLYKAAMKLKYDDYWMRSGYIQPSGQTLLAVHWGFVHGAYQGSEVGGSGILENMAHSPVLIYGRINIKPRGIPKCMNFAPPIIKQKSTTFSLLG